MEQLLENQDEFLNYESDSSVETVFDENEWLYYNRSIESKTNTQPNDSCSKRSINQVKQYRELVTLMRSVVPEKQFTVILAECIKYFKFKLSDDQEKLLKQKLFTFKNTFDAKWRKCHRILTRFENNETKWLDSFITVPEDWFRMSFQNEKKQLKRKHSNSSLCQPETIPGQRKKFNDLTVRGKQKAVQKITQQISALPSSVIIKSAQQVMTQRGEKESSSILREIQKTPLSAKDLLLKIKKKEDKKNEYSPDESLALLLEIGLTQNSYKLLRKEAMERGHKLYASYHLLADAKKLCYPKNMEFRETVAKVPLQCLLDHTVKRIFQVKASLIQSIVEASAECPKFRFYGIYGFDGSSGHSRYNYLFKNELNNPKSDETLFATTFTPLKLCAEDGQTVWENPAPQSFRYCRPLKLEFTKETSGKILEEKLDLEKQIRSLIDTKIEIGSSTVSVQTNLQLTAIDGKCLMTVTGVTKSSQSCPICGCTPKTFNTVENLENSKFKSKPGSLLHGISPLHCWIRLLEFCLKLAYRIPAGVYPVNTPFAKKLFEDTKRAIQEKLRKIMGILVDVVKQGAGTTNNGNMARKAFQNFAEFASIIGVDPHFIKMLYIILATVSSKLPINSHKFGNFCKETFKYYVSKYSWNPMSATLHKVLVHGAEIVENSMLPLGIMSEEGAESRNKIYREDREFHSRQMNPVVNIQDIFQRAMATSCPWISNFFLSHRQKTQKHRSLPAEALELVDPAAVVLEMTGSGESEETNGELLDTNEVLKDLDLQVEDEDLFD